ncbi:hypothetical protein MKZ38_006151 [Zalerion maritima]|uniref:Uncharacterized protein n=1 Tax=Zalerion maritima TaxID=339359 RepID=A0AAD5RK66_9PEZI|nr:hypothetical protein MKZ38_006151 [Zalerion maritima]
MPSGMASAAAIAPAPSPLRCPLTPYRMAAATTEAETYGDSRPSPDDGARSIDSKDAVFAEGYAGVCPRGSTPYCGPDQQPTFWAPPGQYNSPSKQPASDVRYWWHFYKRSSNSREDWPVSKSATSKGSAGEKHYHGGFLSWSHGRCASRRHTPDRYSVKVEGTPRPEQWLHKRQAAKQLLGALTTPGGFRNNDCIASGHGASGPGGAAVTCDISPCNGATSFYMPTPRQVKKRFKVWALDVWHWTIFPAAPRPPSRVVQRAPILAIRCARSGSATGSN